MFLGKIKKLILALLLLSACQSEQESQPNVDEPETRALETTASEASDEPAIEQKVEKENTIEREIQTEFEIQTYQTEAGWGYDILKNGIPFVRQPHRPGLPGKQGFDSEAKAQKTAELVRHKLENNVMPPTVSQQELDSIGVLK